MRFSFSQYLLFRLNWNRKKNTLSRVHYLSIRVYFYCSYFIFHNMLKFEERYGFFPSNKRSSGEKSPKKKTPSKRPFIYYVYSCIQQSIWWWWWSWWSFSQSHSVRVYIRDFHVTYVHIFYFVIVCLLSILKVLCV